MLSSGDYELILFLYTWKLTAQGRVVQSRVKVTQD